MEEDFLETRKNGLTGGGVHTTTGVETDALSVLEKKKTEKFSAISTLAVNWKL